MTARWTRAIALDRLKAKGRAVVRLGGKQIVVFDTGEGPLACNNRCPHEGYPLREGILDDGCVVTCNWHNWKFDLRSGANLYGGDRPWRRPDSTRSPSRWRRSWRGATSS